MVRVWWRVGWRIEWARASSRRGVGAWGGGEVPGWGGWERVEGEGEEVLVVSGSETSEELELELEVGSELESE